MKIIFLDIDGVLNSSRSFAAYQHLDEADEDPDLDYFYKTTMKYLDEVAVGLINRLINETGAKIVLSSTHRKRLHSLVEIDTYLKALGLRGELVGSTPCDPRGHRGSEIKAWLDQHPVKKYVIIDDDSDMLPEQLEFFIHASGENGMSFKNFLDALRVLREETSSSSPAS